MAIDNDDDDDDDDKEDDKERKYLSTLVIFTDYLRAPITVSEF